MDTRRFRGSGHTTTNGEGPDDSDAGQRRSILKIGIAAFSGLIAVIVIAVLVGMFYTIEEYERGVLTRNGAFVKILNPGFGVKAPWIDAIPEEIDMRVKTYTWAQMESYSADQQKAFLKVSATLKPRESRLEQLYKQHRNVRSAVSELLSPLMNKDTKVVFGRYSAPKAIANRGQLNLDVEKVIVDALGNDTVLEIIGIQIEDISFSDAYVQSIEGRMKEEVEVDKHKQVFEKEKVSADIVKTKAAAEAFRVKAIGDAEAEAIRAKSKAMYENPSYIQLIQAERWDGRLPQTMLPNQAMPIIELNTNATKR